MADDPRYWNVKDTQKRGHRCEGCPYAYEFKVVYFGVMCTVPGGVCKRYGA